MGMPICNTVWSDLGRLLEYLLIGSKRGMPWHASTFDIQWHARACSGQLRQNIKV